MVVGSVGSVLGKRLGWLTQCGGKGEKLLIEIGGDQEGDGRRQGTRDRPCGDTGQARGPAVTPCYWRGPAVTLYGSNLERELKRIKWW